MWWKPRPRAVEIPGTAVPDGGDAARLPPGSLGDLGQVASLLRALFGDDGARGRQPALPGQEPFRCPSAGGCDRPGGAGCWRDKKDAQDTGNLLLLAREMPVGAAPGPQGLGKMLCEVLKHILDCWAYINQQERSPKPRAAAQGPTTTGSSAGAPGRGEERVTCRMVFAHLECCVRFPGQCRCQQPPGERAPRLRGSIPFSKYG